MPPNTENSLAKRDWPAWWPWLNAALTLGIILGGVWFLSRTIELSDILLALEQSQAQYIALAIFVFTLNGCLKAWRWQILLAPDAEVKVNYSAVFWAIWLGQFINVVLPLLRLGELSRAYVINRQTTISSVKALSTMVVEKSLELVMLGLLLLILLPILALPENLQESGLTLFLIAGTAVAGLGLVAYQTNRVIAGLRWIFKKLPSTIEKRLDKLVLAGLDGLASLRSRSATQRLLLSSVLLTLLSIATPYLLFLAFRIPLGLAEAAVVDSALSLTTSVPSTPGQLGVFEGTVLLILSQFGQFDQALIVSFAVVYHLVVLLPKLVLGGLAISRTDWRWQAGNA